VRELNKNPDLPLLQAAGSDLEAERQQVREERRQLEQEVAAFEAEKRGKSAHEAETAEHVRRMEEEIIRLHTREKVGSFTSSCSYLYVRYWYGSVPGYVLRYRYLLDLRLS